MVLLLLTNAIDFPYQRKKPLRTIYILLLCFKFSGAINYYIYFILSPEVITELQPIHREPEIAIIRKDVKETITKSTRPEPLLATMGPAPLLLWSSPVRRRITYCSHSANCRWWSHNNHSPLASRRYSKSCDLMIRPCHSSRHTPSSGGVFLTPSQ